MHWKEKLGWDTSENTAAFWSGSNERCESRFWPVSLSYRFHPAGASSSATVPGRRHRCDLCQTGWPILQRKITKVLKAALRHFEILWNWTGFDMIYASTLHTEKFRSYAGQSIAKSQNNLNRIHMILVRHFACRTMPGYHAGYHRLRGGYALFSEGQPRKPDLRCHISGWRKISSKSLRRFSEASNRLCKRPECFFP